MNVHPGERGKPAGEPPEPSFFLRWTLIGTAALAPAALAVPLYLTLTSSWPTATRALVLIMLGALEGLALGLAQAFVMRRHHLLSNERRWVLATAGGSTLAWALFSLLIVAPGPLPAEISTQTYLLWGMHGALIGLAQWLVVRKSIPYFSAWIAICILAWVLGEKLSYPCLVAISNGASPMVMLVPKLCMGLSIAAVTGTGLIFLLGDTLQDEKGLA